MNSVFTWLTANAAALGILGAIGAFAWSIFQFVAVRRKEQEVREFEAFHRLIKELVSPDPDTKSTWIDRQVAATFELRHFRRYDEVTIRILTALREKWRADPQFEWPRLLEEVDLTLQHIRDRTT